MYILSFSFVDRSQMLVDRAYLVQRFVFQESTKRNMHSQLQAYLSFALIISLVLFLYPKTFS